jgi:predicted nucleotide-binding protein
MFESLIVQFSNLLKKAEAQDAVLRDLSKRKEGIVEIATAGPIIALFKEARGLLNDIPEYNYHCDPFSARSQIAMLTTKIASAVQQLQADEVAYSERNKLRVPFDKALTLLKARGSEGAGFQDSYIVRADEDVQRWLTDVARTFARIFATSWHVQQFEQRMKEQVGGESEAQAAKRALHYLQEVIEDLFLCEPAELENEQGEAVLTARGQSEKIFIGHGGSLVWLKLRMFLCEKLHLNCDEFTDESPAGIGTTARLQSMLDAARFAFLLMTSEDIHADGTTHARENVIHEAGLFQGRLGFGRAIILLEDGCAEFSNIHGLGQIRFPKGNIDAVFERIREVLRREHVIV